MTFTYNDAVAIATDAHAGVLDKGGDPYLWHVLRVAEMLTVLGCDEETRIAAVLHDVVEDTAWTLQMLREQGVPERSLAMIDAVSRRADPALASGKEKYQAGLIARAAANRGGRLIKLIDNAHNSLPRRTLAGSGCSDMERQRYRPARRTLLSAERDHLAVTGEAPLFPLDPDQFMQWAVALDADLETKRLAYS